MNPAGGFTEASAELAALALQQRNFAGWFERSLSFHIDATSRLCRVDHAPFGEPFVQVERRRGTVLHEELGNVESDAAGADDRDAPADIGVVPQDVDVTQNVRMILAGYLRVARHDARGEDDGLVGAGHELRGRNALVEMQVHVLELDLPIEVAQHLVELFLARNDLGHVELAADLIGGLEQVDFVAAFCEHQRSREPGGTGAYDRVTSRRRGRRVVQLGFMAGARVDEARAHLVRERVIEAGLVTRNADIDFVSAPGRGFVDEFRVGEQGSRHRHHVSAAVGQYLVGDMGQVDAVRRHERNRHLALHFPGHPGEGASGHRCGDRRDAGLVPANAGIDESGARFFDSFREHDRLFPATAIRNQVDHRKTVDDDEVPADRFARSRHDLYRQAHTLRIITAPFVFALVCVGNQELVDEIALGAHYLDAIVTRVARQHRAADEVSDLGLDAG